MLQTRNAKRVGIAGVRWAVEMATGVDAITGAKLPKLLSPKDALMTVQGSDLEQLLFPIFDAKAARVCLPVQVLPLARSSLTRIKPKRSRRRIQTRN